MNAIRNLLASGKDGYRKEALRAAVARAATLIEPDAEARRKTLRTSSRRCSPRATTRPPARWARAVARMDDDDADRCWAMLALASPGKADVSSGRIQAFIRRDKSQDKLRSSLLVAGLAGLGRISTDGANSLNRRYGLGLGRTTGWTRIIDAAAGARPGGDGAGPDRHRIPDAELRPSCRPRTCIMRSRA